MQMNGLDDIPVRGPPSSSYEQLRARVQQQESVLQNGGLVSVETGSLKRKVVVVSVRCTSSCNCTRVSSSKPPHFPLETGAVGEGARSCCTGRAVGHALPGAVCGPDRSAPNRACCHNQSPHRGGERYGATLNREPVFGSLSCDSEGCSVQEWRPAQNRSVQEWRPPQNRCSHAGTLAGGCARPSPKSGPTRPAAPQRSDRDEPPVGAERAESPLCAHRRHPRARRSHEPPGPCRGGGQRHLHTHQRQSKVGRSLEHHGGCPQGI